MAGPAGSLPSPGAPRRCRPGRSVTRRQRSPLRHRGRPGMLCLQRTGDSSPLAFAFHSAFPVLTPAVTVGDTADPGTELRTFSEAQLPAEPRPFLRGLSSPSSVCPGAAVEHGLGTFRTSLASCACDRPTAEGVQAALAVRRGSVYMGVFSAAAGGDRSDPGLLPHTCPIRQ